MSYRNTCLLALTESWLKERDPQSDLEIDGFGVLFCLGTDLAVTSESLGSGDCLYVDTTWCNTVVVKEKLCTTDIELLSVSLQAFYLPREFLQLFATLVYVHLKTKADVATQAMLKTAAAASGDFTGHVPFYHG